MAKDITLSYGDYVNRSTYKLMRLRIVITGTSGPSEDQMSSALTRLLNHLEKYPLPKEGEE